MQPGAPVQPNRTFVSRSRITSAKWMPDRKTRLALNEVQDTSVLAGGLIQLRVSFFLVTEDKARSRLNGCLSGAAVSAQRLETTRYFVLVPDPQGDGIAIETP